ncbi:MULTISPECIES: hypothetical protein [Sphingobacterium]|uniref:hypothetical protein n=1 Tax=Sphingobacterium TaxID=28453 RepID=UPI00257DA166|nr:MULTISPECIES: hypothetical protein [Sphingobacterium]
MVSVPGVEPVSLWYSSRQGAIGSETNPIYPPIRSGQIRMSGQGTGHSDKVQTSPWWAGGAKVALLINRYMDM